MECILGVLFDVFCHVFPSLFYRYLFYLPPPSISFTASLSTAYGFKFKPGFSASDSDREEIFHSSFFLTSTLHLSRSSPLFILPAQKRAAVDPPADMPATLMDN
ncbi:unnamed protein product [Lactuca virosa]|uniref:Uncharacterized protein n=1 Tax=Lactuca virosa TaxID=75947 RepID=A0AAU9PLV3_9ASTR|nr:unnamed protein product [Lactuca virosa]